MSRIDELKGAYHQAITELAEARAFLETERDIRDRYEAAENTVRYSERTIESLRLRLGFAALTEGTAEDVDYFVEISEQRCCDGYQDMKAMKLNPACILKRN